MTSSELLLRNSQIHDTSLNLTPANREEKIFLNENGELISEHDLTKNKVKKTMLESMLVHSKKLVSPSTNQDIKEKMNLIEERVYWRGTTDQNTYFHKLYQQLQESHPNMPVEYPFKLLISKPSQFSIFFESSWMNKTFKLFFQQKEAIQKVNDINDKIIGKIQDGNINVNKRNHILNKSELYVLESSFYKRRLSNKKLSLEHKINNLDNHIDYLRSLRPNGQLDKSMSTRGMNKSVHELTSEQFNSNSEKQYQDPKEFLKKIKKQSIITRAELDEKKRKEEERKRKIEEQIEMERQEERRKRHQELQKSFQLQRDNQKQRQEQITKSQVDFQQFYKNYKEKKPLFEIMEENYKQQGEIEIQQEKLLKIRELYRPHKLEDFEDHYRRYKDFKQSEAERLLLKKNAFQSTKSLQSNTSMWRGRVHELIEEELKNQHRLSASEDRKLRQDRQKQYASMVNLNHAPKIERQKKEEIEKRITNLQKPKNLIQIQLQKQEIETEPNSYKIGTDYFEFAKKFNREHKKQEDEKVKEQRLQQQSDDINIRVSMQKAQYKNYMKEERVKQILKKDDPKKNWESQINRLQGTEKVEKVLMAAQQLDVQARRKEQMLKYNKNVDQNYAEDLDDCYFNSIKAKIALLKDFHQITK